MASLGAVRKGKSHLYSAELLAGDGGYGFDSLGVGPNDKTVTSVGTAAAGTTTLLQVSLPQDASIVKIVWGAAVVTSTAATDVKVNFQAQTGTAMADSGLTAPPASGGAVIASFAYPAANSLNNFLFATSPNFYSVAGGSATPITTVAYPDNPEARYKAGTRIVMQIITTANGSVTQPITFCLLLAPLDAQQYKTKAADPTTDF